MLKLREEVFVDDEGRSAKSTTFTCGPLHGIGECGKCPFLWVDIAHGWSSCGFYKTGLSYTGPYPRECKVTKIVVTEKF